MCGREGVWMNGNELVPVSDQPVELLREFSIDHLNLPGYLEIKEKILNIDNIPDRAMIILGLRAMGLGVPHIAKICRIGRSTVTGYLERYDPQGICRITNEDKRRITSQMLMSGAMAAMMEITPEKLEESDAKDLAAIATKCVLTAEKIRELDKGDSGKVSRLDATLSYLDMEDE
jgi:transposase